MFLITFKRGINSEKSKIEFDHPLTFSNANEMLIEAVARYKQTGQSMKVSYKVIDKNSGESLFNSKIVIDKEIPSLFQIIKENSSVPKEIIDYVKKVENREIVEEASIPFNTHGEEIVRLEQLKTEKNEILQQLKSDEKERQQRDLEYQQKMIAIQEEKKALEKALQLKEKEEAVKEAQRLEAIRLLEEERRQAMQLMEEKRNLDKKRKEEHEARLKEIEDEAQKTQVELASIEAEIEKKELERKKELKDLEEKKKEAGRKVNLLKAQDSKDEVEHQQLLVNYKEPVEAHVLPKISKKEVPMKVPKLTLKEKLQELDFEEVKGRSIQFVKYSAEGSVKGSKKAFKMLKEYRSKRLVEKEEKQKNLKKQVDIEEKVALEKIKFMEELKEERLKQERELKRAAKQKEKDELQQIRIENRYRAAKKRSLGRIPIYNSGPFKFIVGSIAIIVAAFSGIHYFNLGETYPILNELEGYKDAFISMIINAIQRS